MKFNQEKFLQDAFRLFMCMNYEKASFTKLAQVTGMTGTTFWSAGDMKRHGINMNLVQMNGLIPSTFQVILILGIMAGISILLIDCLYKKRGE